jgi:predicted metal-dependent phosphoesterase TrpH
VADTVRVDLHCHSSASDGDHSPAHVAKRLADTGVSWASLTDHNTVAGQAEFRAALNRHAISYIPGVEIDARSSLGHVHILGYGIDLENAALLAVLDTVRHPLRASARRMLRRLRSADHGTVTSAPAYGPEGDTPPKRPLSTATAISLIHDAGGLAFLAHPIESLGTFEKLEQVLDLLQPEGLDGLEVFHKAYPERAREGLLAMAQRRGLLPTGGSDFHGLAHSDGAVVGVEMPVEHWAQMVRRVGDKQDPVPFSLPNDKNAG